MNWISAIIILALEKKLKLTKLNYFSKHITAGFGPDWLPLVKKILKLLQLKAF